MLRHERATGSALGHEAEQWTQKGLLFPDELALRVVLHWLDGGRWDGFLLDGFPRTLGQATAFDSALEARGLAEDVLILQLDLSEDQIRSRVMDRLTCRKCGATYGATFHHLDAATPCPVCQGALERRKDDTMEALEQRLVQYRDFTIPVCEFYTKSKRLVAIDASRTREEIHRSVCDAVMQGGAV